MNVLYATFYVQRNIYTEIFTNDSRWTLYDIYGESASYETTTSDNIVDSDNAESEDDHKIYNTLLTSSRRRSLSSFV